MVPVFVEKWLHIGLTYNILINIYRRNVPPYIVSNILFFISSYITSCFNLILPSKSPALLGFKICLNNPLKKGPLLSSLKSPKGFRALNHYQVIKDIS